MCIRDSSTCMCEYLFLVFIFSYMDCKRSWYALHVCASVCLCICGVSLYVSVSMYVSIWVHEDEYVYVCEYMSAWGWVCVCMWLYECMRMSMCMHARAHTHIENYDEAHKRFFSLFQNIFFLFWGEAKNTQKGRWGKPLSSSHAHTHTRTHAHAHAQTYTQAHA